jgi:hypothetical protein
MKYLITGDLTKQQDMTQQRQNLLLPHPVHQQLLSQPSVAFFLVLLLRHCPLQCKQNYG